MKGGGEKQADEEREVDKHGGGETWRGRGSQEGGETVRRRERGAAALKRRHWVYFKVRGHAVATALHYQ